MAKTLENISQLDPIWGRLVQEAQDAVEQEPLLGGMLHSCVLHHRGIEQALAYRIASKLASPDMSEQLIR
ncbi:MAG: serine O-acetyltransferase, partial [Rhodobacteraceae bacterium]|nr:serine O-acetyltransferase [Paracoccaceae bacterium]